MKNRDIYQRDPGEITLMNNGVASMTDALTDDERSTLRFELEHFVCEGEYQRGLVRILASYMSNLGRNEQPAAWVSGFFGSGKSHLAKMLRFLWADYRFEKDGATARGLARLPAEVQDLLKELTMEGRRAQGLHAAAGTLGAGAGDSVRLALLGIVFKSADLPESYPQARFCLWLKKHGIYDEVRTEVEKEGGRDFLRELNDLYVSPLIARALLAADPDFAGSEKDTRATLREQFPKPKDISNDEFVGALQDALAPEGGMPYTVIILDEVQQYIGEDSQRSYVVQEVVEACSKRFGDRLLFLGTGQTALSGTPALQRLQGRFTVNVELSDTDVETVTRRVVLAKRADRVKALQAKLDDNIGEIDRHLVGTRIAPRSEDKLVLVEDYPLLPVRRRFWEQTLRAVDRAGTAGQLRTQLRMVHDAVRLTADEPVGTVVPADYLFDEQAANLLQSGVLLREVHQAIMVQNDGTPAGRLKSRLCALVFLIRKLPREAGVDIGVRATVETLADLLVEDLARDGVALRAQLPKLLDELVTSSTLMKLDNEYSLQTRESSEWEAEFRSRQTRLSNDPTRMSSKRTEYLGVAVRESIGSVRLLHGKSKEPRKLRLYFGTEPPLGNTDEIPVWVRDGWGADERSVLADARSAGTDNPLIQVFVPKSRAEALARVIAAQSAAKDTLEYKGVPSTPEGHEARQGMQTTQNEAQNRLHSLIREVVDAAKVYQGGGNEILELSLPDKLREAADASLDRLYYQFGEADDQRWPKVIERARKGAEHPLEALAYNLKTETHPVCSAVLSFVGSGKKGKDVRSHFSAPPYGWPRDAVDAALISLFGAGHLRVSSNGASLKPGQLDQANLANADFRVESATLDTRQRITLRKLFQQAGVACKPNEEDQAATAFLGKLGELAAGAGGEAPLPECPNTRHLSDLQALAGNEQLLGILQHQDELRENIKDWTRKKELAEQRFPAYRLMQSLAQHAAGLEAVQEILPQVEAIMANRSLLEAADPTPALSSALTSTLRAALTQADKSYRETYSAEWARLQAAEGWRQLATEDCDRILQGLHITEVSKGAAGTEQEVLESLERISLHGWQTRTAALPQLFADARAEADRLVEPKIRHLKLSSASLRTPEDVRAWVETTERDLLREVQQGPIVIG